MAVTDKVESSPVGFVSKAVDALRGEDDGAPQSDGSESTGRSYEAGVGDAEAETAGHAGMGIIGKFQSAMEEQKAKEEAAHEKDKEASMQNALRDSFVK